MKKLLIIIMAIAAFGAYAKNDKNAATVTTVTDAEVLALLKAQYENALATSNLNEIAKWHLGKKSQKLNDEDFTMTHTFNDGFEFTTNSGKRNKGKVNKNTENKIMAKAKDPRIHSTKAKISNLKKMLDNSKSYSLPTAAIEAALANEQAFLDKLTGKAEVVTVKTEIGKEDWRVRSTKLNIKQLEQALSKSENYSEEKIAEIENALANEKEYLNSLTNNSVKAHYDVDPDNVHTLKVEE